MNQHDEQGAYTVETLARRLSVSPRSIRKWYRQKRIVGAVKCGRSIRFDREQIENRIVSGVFLLEKTFK